jgi:hypothetical protein
MRYGFSALRSGTEAFSLRRARGSFADIPRLRFGADTIISGNNQELIRICARFFPLMRYRLVA